MEIIIALIVVLAVVAIWYSTRDTGLDVNKDGKVDLSDAKAAVAKTVADVKSVADVNKDGKVDAADVKAVATKTKAAAKKAASKAKTAVKAAAKKTSTRGRKPKA